MPSKTRRKYRGGDNLSNCEKWAVDNSLSDIQKNQCKEMEKKIVFPTQSFFSKGKPKSPITGEDVIKGEDLKKEYWDDIYKKLFNPVVEAPVVSNTPQRIQKQRSTYIMEPMWKNCNIKTPDGKFKVTGPNNSQSEECNVNKCDAYDKEHGKNVLKKMDGTYTDACDSAQLPTCTQWKKKGDTWATTGPNGEFCNVAALPMGNVFSKLNTQSEANVNMDRATYPLQRHPSGIVYASGNYDQYRGGKRSRRKSRKSRR